MQIVPGIDLLQGGEIISPLSRRTSMGIGGTPTAEVRVFDLGKIDALPGLLERTGLPVHILGAGSNILAQDGLAPFAILTLETGLLPEVTGKAGELTLVRCGSDTALPVLLAKLASFGLAGLSGLAGIPGSVGGAVAMNAGSFGVEIGDYVHSVQVFSPKLGLVDLPADHFTFNYRHTALNNHEGWFLIVSVTFALTAGKREEILEHARACLIEKKAKQPLGQRSAGCVFKNPSKDAPAGKLLEEAGMKLERLGGVMFSDIHANFMVNTGYGLFRDALELIKRAQERVLAMSGWKLDLEVRLWF